MVAKSQQNVRDLMVVNIMWDQLCRKHVMLKHRGEHECLYHLLLLLPPVKPI